MSRTNIILSSIVGLLGAVAVTIFCIYAVNQGWNADFLYPPLLENPVFIWGLFIFLLFFSLAEIPIMIFGLRRLARGKGSRINLLVWLTNIGYIIFGAAYAAPFILLTNRIYIGSGLAALSFVRFITSIVFVTSTPPKPRRPKRKEVEQDQ